MAQRIRIADWGKGLNLDQAAWEIEPGFWSNGQNVRFRQGNAERIGGVASVITPSNAAYFILPYSSGATRYAAYCGLTKAYAHDGSSETDITPAAVTPAQTITAASHAGATITITTGSAHGLTTGDIIGVSGFSPSGYNTTGATITVTSGTTFTYVVPASPVGSVTFGTYTVIYHAGAAAGSFTATADTKWTGGNFNGVMYVNNPVDGLFYWDQAITGKLHTFFDTTVTIQDAARHFKNYIFLLAPTTGGTKYRHRAQWSQAAEPGSVPLSFTASSTNDAGLVDLPTDGEMVDAVQWGDTFIIYKRDSRFRCTYIGGNYVFQFDAIRGHKDDGLLSPNCAVNTPKGQVFLTDGHDIRIHQGADSQSIAIGRVLKYLRSNIDATNRKRSFLVTSPYTSEVWVCYPETGQSACSKALIWNWEYDTWGTCDLTNVTSGAAGEFPMTIAATARTLIANTTPAIGLLDSGTTYFGSSYQTLLERQGIDFDTPDFKTLSESMPRFDAATNFTASIYHGSSPTQDGAVTYTSAQTYTHNTTQRITALANSGRYGAWKVTTTAADTPALKSIDFWVTLDGEW